MLKKIACPEQKLLIRNENFDDFDLVVELSLRIRAINIVLQFEKDWQSDTKDIDWKWFRLRTDRRTDGQTDKVNPVYTPTNFVGGIIIQYWLLLRLAFLDQ